MNSAHWRTHLADVDWPTLEHAYGDASDVPGWIEGLTGAETVEESLHELSSAVLHQGTLYDSTEPAMTSIASVLGARQTADAAGTAWLLLMFADAVHDYEQVGVDDVETAALVRSARDSLLGIAALVRPLIADDGPEAAASALLQAAARTADSAAVETLSARADARPAAQVEQACVAALTTLGADVAAALADGDPGLMMAATLARIAAGSTETTDLDALVTGWELAVEVASHIAFDVGNLPEWLSATNPEASAHVLAALPMPDETTIAGLVDVVVGSRSNAPAAVRRLLALAALPEAGPESMIAALRQCPATPEVRDALVALAERVTTGDTSAIGSSTFDTDARTDAALALLRAGDGRWARPMAQALLTNPAARGLMVATSASGRSALGYALVREHAPSSTMVVAGIRQALRQKPPADPSRDGAGHLVELLASWPAEAAADALSEVRELLAVAPRQSADALATWGDTAGIDRVREASVTGDATVLLALARLTKDTDDFHHVLDADLEHKESEVLAHWADPTDRRFLDWCRGLVGTKAATSDHQRGNQLTALRILAAVDSDEAATGWPVLRSIIDAGRGPIEEAIGLALDWRARQLLPPEACTDFEALLTDLVVTDRKDYNGPIVKTSAAAAIALLDVGLPLPDAPARIVKVVAGAVTDRWARELGLRLAERLAAAPETVRRAVAKKLRSLVDRDERFDSTGDIAVEDARTVARLRPILHKLETE
ncbi:hypothetical protein [Rhodococcus sp. AG1013]|uniref:hypothetical protein n=1 Tax=unclassified Rhodococcus (in: high G+C Gram-positive bacteria) TaxID=192944 RepID=UPI000E0C7134|nr:hypothetical protein [Rhodococcus sp. AG1013]RDI31364.1 hypothetical protein DEU38_10477 [Rhodococcus sp. AG1013]